MYVQYHLDEERIGQKRRKKITHFNNFFTDGGNGGGGGGGGAGGGGAGSTFFRNNQGIRGTIHAIHVIHLLSFFLLDFGFGGGSGASGFGGNSGYNFFGGGGGAGNTGNSGGGSGFQGGNTASIQGVPFQPATTIDSIISSSFEPLGTSQSQHIYAATATNSSFNPIVSGQQAQYNFIQQPQPHRTMPPFNGMYGASQGGGASQIHRGGGGPIINGDGVKIEPPDWTMDIIESTARVTVIHILWNLY